MRIIVTTRVYVGRMTTRVPCTRHVGKVIEVVYTTHYGVPSRNNYTHDNILYYIIIVTTTQVRKYHYYCNMFKQYRYVPFRIYIYIYILHTYIRRVYDIIQYICIRYIDINIIIYCTCYTYFAVSIICIGTAKFV